MFGLAILLQEDRMFSVLESGRSFVGGWIKAGLGYPPAKVAASRGALALQPGEPGAQSAEELHRLRATPTKAT